VEVWQGWVEAGDDLVERRSGHGGQQVEEESTGDARTEGVLAGAPRNVLP